jgi:hypothetical protein
MAGFQAVDLDSILDEFEFKQNEAEKEIKPENSHIYLDKDNKGGTWSQPVSNTVILFCNLTRMASYILPKCIMLSSPNAILSTLH